MFRHHWFSIFNIFLYCSAHGTFIGTIRLERKNPQQVPIDSELHFGASSRRYVIREKPHTSVTSMMLDEKEEMEGALLGLPETETELNVSDIDYLHVLIPTFKWEVENNDLASNLFT